MDGKFERNAEGWREKMRLRIRRHVCRVCGEMHNNCTWLWKGEVGDWGVDGGVYQVIFSWMMRIGNA